MNLDEAARILREMCDSAGLRHRTVAVLLFGINYGQEIQAIGLRPSEIAHQAGLSADWGPRISDGINLAAFVIMNPGGLTDKLQRNVYQIEYDFESRKMEWDKLIRKVPPDKGDLVKMKETFSESSPEKQKGMICLARKLVNGG